MIGKPIHIIDGFWRGNRLATGKLIDEWFGQNIPSNSRTIDRTVGTNCVVSHKSTDLRLKSYTSPNRVYSLGISFVKTLSNYSGEVRRNRKIRATYDLRWAVDSSDSRRILAWFVPLDIPEGHERMLERVVRDAEDYGVEVEIFRVSE